MQHKDAGIKSENKLLENKFLKMLKFDELYDLDISAKVKKHKGLDYLNWLDCLLLLRGLGMTPEYSVLNVRELPISGQIIVDVWVKIGDKEAGITYTDCRSRDFEFIKQRAFVKCVATNWGLGLKLWAAAEGGDATPIPEGESPVPAITMSFDNKRQELGLSTADELHAKMGTSKAFLGKLLAEGSREDQLAFLQKIEQFKLPSTNDLF